MPGGVYPGGRCRAATHSGPYARPGSLKAEGWFDGKEQHGTPQMELYILYARLAEQARAKGIRIARRLVGNYITALEMQGFSLTLLKADAEILALWDAPVHTPGLRWGM